jgi:hypothetical protein
MSLQRMRQRHLRILIGLPQRSAVIRGSPLQDVAQSPIAIGATIEQTAPLHDNLCRISATTAA